MSEERLSFQTEVGRLLHIVANSLYSERQIFLRELISNASDACDRLRYEAITRPELVADDPEYRIRIVVDKAARTLEIADNGIGMNRAALVDDLGTIARSGTAAFLERLTGDARKDMAMIGQFGVGFYSAFMVADTVAVVTRRAGEAEAWRWASDGKGTFTVAPAEKETRGTRVILSLAADADEFLEPARLAHVVKTYSDHIAIPILFVEDGAEEKINAAAALWMRPRAEITAAQYAEFYHHVGHAFDEPWATLHWRAEGTIEYTALLFIPSTKPFDLFNPERKHRVKLYVRRVFITENCDGLVPAWLRFVRGLVDTEDLPLNISRELLQANPRIARIRSGIVKRVLGDLARKAEKEPDAFAAFWDNFGGVLKEGLYEPSEHRDEILALARFRTTAGETLASLEDYVGRMKEGQSAIYYLTGEDRAMLDQSPHLEGFRARGIEVLLLTDPIDEFWIPAVRSYKEKPFRSVTKGGADLAGIGEALATEGEPVDVGALLALLKLALKDAVKDVRVSDRLTESPVCLVADEADLDIRLERLLKQHRQLDEASLRILEINPRHPLMRALAADVGRAGAASRLEDAAWLLLDQARIMDGDPLPDPAAFARRMSAVMARAIGG
ncbi:MAG: molecular chaperone HtpG [Alphaproteobacteria bacterium]|nr:molecular chaperone HtpG [Alphaproteobacteria bacterium]